jgi:hypothetical protein
MGWWKFTKAHIGLRFAHGFQLPVCVRARARVMKPQSLVRLE